MSKRAIFCLGTQKKKDQVRQYLIFFVVQVVFSNGNYEIPKFLIAVGKAQTKRT